MKITRKQLVLAGVWLVVLDGLAGCALTPVGEEDFGCSGLEEGVRCLPVREVYRATNTTDRVQPTEAKDRNAGVKSAAKEEPAAATTTTALPIAFAPTVRADGSIPIRTPPRVMRILVGSWEDQRNTLHLAGYVFTEITPRQWQVGLPAPPGSTTLRPLQTVAAPPETKESLAQTGRHRRTPRSLVEQALGSAADTLQGARNALQPLPDK